MNQLRKTMLQRVMEKHKLGALVFWRPDELVMLLGYLPHWGVSFLVYTASGEAILYIPEVEPRDILPADIPLETFPFGVLDCEDPWNELFQKIKANISKSAVDSDPISFIRAIGGTTPCRMSAEQPPLPSDLIERLSMLSSWGYKDAAADLLRLYLYKTPEDLSALKRTHAVAKKAVERFYACVQAGITEKQIANEIEAIVQSEIGKDDIQFAKAWPMIQSGKNTCYSGLYNRTSDRKLCQSELVLIEMGICVNGYWADITRTATVGEISLQYEQLFEVVVGAQEETLSMMRPGTAMAKVDAVARDHITRAGWGHLYNHALGHQTGFRYHDPGPMLSPASTGILEEGMVLTVEPGIYGEEVGGGIRVEENVLITSDGCEILSTYPKSLTGK